MNPFRNPAHQRTPILNLAPDAREVDGVVTMRLYDPVDSYGEWWGVSSKEFAAALDGLGDGVTQINLFINSPGGEVWEGIAIGNALKAHPAKVIVTVEGIAASIASVIAMAGDEVIMARNAELMIHEASGLCVGQAVDMRDLADQLDRIGANLASAYADRAGGTPDEWRALMRDETWFSADEAVKAGLADRVLPVSKADDSGDGKDSKATAAFDLSVFAHAGRANAPTPNIPLANRARVPAAAGSTITKEARVSDTLLTSLRESLGLPETADEAAVMAAHTAAMSSLEELTNATDQTTLPDGVVTIDAEVLAQLRATAQQGAEARAQQQQEARERLVAAAVRDGRIAPSQREGWLRNLTADEPGASVALAALQPGLIPVSEIGTDKGADTSDDDAFYASLFPSEKASA